jgi:hypothetical protein
MTLPQPVAALIIAGRLERVPADRPSALTRPTRGEEKLKAARKIAEIDVEVAYVTGYDATRIAVTAHMLANGYRVRPIARAHEAVGVYAEAMISIPSASEFQRMRRWRNSRSTTTSPSASPTSRLISRTLRSRPFEMLFDQGL